VKDSREAAMFLHSPGVLRMTPSSSSSSRSSAEDKDDNDDKGNDKGNYGSPDNISGSGSGGTSQCLKRTLEQQEEEEEHFENDILRFSGISPEYLHLFIERLKEAGINASISSQSPPTNNDETKLHNNTNYNDSTQQNSEVVVGGGGGNDDGDVLVKSVHQVIEKLESEIKASIREISSKWKKNKKK
jgi:hypothetical protein